MPHVQSFINLRTGPRVPSTMQKVRSDHSIQHLDNERMQKCLEKSLDNIHSKQVRNRAEKEHMLRIAQKDADNILDKKNIIHKGRAEDVLKSRFIIKNGYLEKRSGALPISADETTNNTSGLSSCKRPFSAPADDIRTVDFPAANRHGIKSAKSSTAGFFSRTPNATRIKLSENFMYFRQCSSFSQKDLAKCAIVTVEENPENRLFHGVKRVSSVAAFPDTKSTRFYRLPRPKTSPQLIRDNSGFYCRRPSTATSNRILRRDLRKVTSARGVTRTLRELRELTHIDRLHELEIERRKCLIKEIRERKQREENENLQQRINAFCVEIEAFKVSV